MHQPFALLLHAAVPTVSHHLHICKLALLQALLCSSCGCLECTEGCGRIKADACLRVMLLYATDKSRFLVACTHSPFNWSADTRLLTSSRERGDHAAQAMCLAFSWGRTRPWAGKLQGCWALLLQLCQLSLPTIMNATDSWRVY